MVFARGRASFELEFVRDKVADAAVQWRVCGDAYTKPNVSGHAAFIVVLAR